MGSKRNVLAGATLAAVATMAAACGQAAQAHTTGSVGKSTKTGTSSSVSAQEENAVYGKCLTRYVHAAPGIAQGTAGSVYQVIVFKNLDNVPCHIDGYPQINVAHGLPIHLRGLASTHEQGTTAHPIRVPAYGYFHVVLRLVDPGNYKTSSCKPIHTNWVQLLFPGEGSPLYFPLQANSCAKIHTMSVGPFQSGKGTV